MSRRVRSSARPSPTPRPHSQPIGKRRKTLFPYCLDLFRRHLLILPPRLRSPQKPELVEIAQLHEVSGRLAHAHLALAELAVVEAIGYLHELGRPAAHNQLQADLEAARLDRH